MSIHQHMLNDRQPRIIDHLIESTGDPTPKLGLATDLHFILMKNDAQPIAGLNSNSASNLRIENRLSGSNVRCQGVVQNHRSLQCEDLLWFSLRCRGASIDPETSPSKAGPGSNGTVSRSR